MAATGIDSRSVYPMAEAIRSTNRELAGMKPSFHCLVSLETKIRGNPESATPTQEQPLMVASLSPSRLIRSESGHKIRPWNLHHQLSNSTVGRIAPVPLEQVHQVAPITEPPTFPRRRIVNRLARVRGEDAEPVVRTDRIVLQIVGIGGCNLVRSVVRRIDGNALILLLRTAQGLRRTGHIISHLVLTGDRVNDAVSAYRGFADYPARTQIDNALLVTELRVSEQPCLVERVAVRRCRRHGHQNTIRILESGGIGDSRLVTAKGIDCRCSARRNHLLHLGRSVVGEFPGENILCRAVIGLRRGEADPRRAAVQRVEVESEWIGLRVVNNVVRNAYCRRSFGSMRPLNVGRIKPYIEFSRLGRGRRRVPNHHAMDRAVRAGRSVACTA